MHETRRFLRSELNLVRVFGARSRNRLALKSPLDLKREYFITTERGVYRLSSEGLFHVLPWHTYGMVVQCPWVFVAIHVDNWSLVLRGRSEALFRKGVSFEFQEAFRCKTVTTHSRVHGMAADGSGLWLTNTGSGSLVKVDMESLMQEEELFLLRDRFGYPIRHDVNHINGVSVYGDIRLFTAYHAGEGGLAGILWGDTVTGYATADSGIHDVYLGTEDFLLCNTFGPSRGDTRFGCLINRGGILDPDGFFTPPGFVTRGVAGDWEELLIGHSHKGERAKRFKGRGAILLLREGRISQRFDLEASQVYQVLTADGQNLLPRPTRPMRELAHRWFRQSFGEPVYRGHVERIAFHRAT